MQTVIYSSESININLGFESQQAALKPQEINHHLPNNQIWEHNGQNGITDARWGSPCN